MPAAPPPDITVMIADWLATGGGRVVVVVVAPGVAVVVVVHGDAGRVIAEAGAELGITEHGHAVSLDALPLKIPGHGAGPGR